MAEYRIYAVAKNGESLKDLRFGGNEKEAFSIARLMLAQHSTVAKWKGAVVNVVFVAGGNQFWRGQISKR